jgi:hypothetical protein
MTSSPARRPGAKASTRVPMSAVVEGPITISSSWNALTSSATERRAASTRSPARCDGA